MFFHENFEIEDLFFVTCYTACGSPPFMALAHNTNIIKIYIGHIMHFVWNILSVWTLFSF